MEKVRFMRPPCAKPGEGDHAECYEGEQWLSNTGLAGKSRNQGPPPCADILARRAEPTRELAALCLRPARRVSVGADAVRRLPDLFEFHRAAIGGHAVHDIVEGKSVGALGAENVRKISVEQRMHGAFYSLLGQPGAACRGSRDLYEPCAVQRTLVGLVPDIARGVAEHPLEITLEHGGHGAEPHRIDQHEDVGSSEPVALGKNLGGGA